MPTPLLLSALAALLLPGVRPEVSESAIGGRLTLLPKMNGATSFVRKKGEKFAITCKFEAYTDDHLSDFHWVGPGGAPISQDEQASVRVLSLGKEQMLMFNGVEGGDEGEYRCQAKVVGTQLQAKAPLIVIGSPGWVIGEAATWVDEEEVVGAMVGERLFVDCRAEGDPRPSVTITNGYNQLFKDGRFSMADDRLTIDPLQETDEGMTVLCTAAQAFSPEGITNVQTKRIRISVWLTPDMERGKMEYYGIVGRNGSLRCGVKRSKPRVSSWSFFAPKSHRLIKHDGSKYIVQPASNATFATLHIRDVSEGDFGDYKCVANNGKSSGEMFISFAEALAPGPVQVRFLRASPSAVTWGVVESGERGELPVSQLRILVLRQDLLDRAKTPEETRDLWLYQPLTFTLTKGGSGAEYASEGLRPGTRYAFRFSAVNEAGWGEPFEVAASTLPLTTAAAPVFRALPLLALALLAL